MIDKNKDVIINGYSILEKLFKKYENEKWVYPKNEVENLKNKIFGIYSNSSLKHDYLFYATKSGIGIGGLGARTIESSRNQIYFYNSEGWNAFEIDSICFDDFKLRLKTNKSTFIITKYSITYKHIQTPDWRTYPHTTTILITKSEYNFFNEFIFEFEKEIDKKYTKLLEKIENDKKERKIRKIEKRKIEKINNEKWLKKQEERRLNQIQIKKVLKEDINTIIDDFDMDKDGIIDFNQGGDDFMNLLKKHQNTIIEVDQNHITKFIQISNYLKTKRENIQTQFESIKKSKNTNQLKVFINLLKNQIDTFNLLSYNSFIMIISLVEKDLLTFNEIYLTFDKLNIFNSNWENEVSNKLNNIDLKLDDLIFSINKMELSIINEILNMSIMNQVQMNRLNKNVKEGNMMIDKNLSRLNSSLSSNLKSINSTLKVGNFINTINTYQNYKTNRRLNS